MFTAREYRAHLPRLLSLPLVACQYWELGDLDFERGGEESACIARASDRAFEGALHFFVNTLRFVQHETSVLHGTPPNPASGTFEAYAQASLHEMKAEQFRLFAEAHLPTRHKPRHWPFGPAAGFRRAMRIEADWDDVAAIAQFEGAYAALFWSTSA